MKLPFYRTFRQARVVGWDRTFSALLAVVFRTFLGKVRFFPDCAVVNVNGFKMFVRPKSGGIHSDLFLYGEREPFCTQYLLHSNLLNLGDCVLDIGANIGYYVLLESNLVGVQGQIYAVEPVLGNFVLLKKNVDFNNLVNVASYQFAVGGRDCEAEIFVSNQANLCRMKKYVDVDIVGTQKVHMNTVDTFLQGKKLPKLIRMDVEGYEYEVLKGMSQTLKKDVALLIEVHPQFLKEKLGAFLGILEENNFRVRFAVDEFKVKENVVIQSLVQKAENRRLPFYLVDVSVRELEKELVKNPCFAPNIFFQKV